MRKLILTLIAGLSVTLGVQAGVTTNANGQIVETFTNSFDQVFEVVIGTAGSTTVPSEIPNAQTIVIGTSAPTATPDQLGQIAIDRGDNAYVAVGGTSSDWVLVTRVAQSDTDATTTATEYTPLFVGQVLTGGAGTGTNAIWIAKGVTTNDWIQVEP